MMSKKFCRKCLLEDMDEDDFLRRLKQHIAEYPTELRAEESLYRERLSYCRECSELSNGMCSRCGCYVELRALKRNMYCPDETPKW